MKTNLLTLALAACSLSALAVEPIITLKTAAYDAASAGKMISFALMATEETTVQVDFGAGPVDYKIGPNADATTAPLVQGVVPADGIIKVYGEASLIDYVDMQGAYVTELSMPSLTNLEVLILDHNQLTDIDLSPFSKLTYLSLRDNQFSYLNVPNNLPELRLLDLSYCGQVSYSFSLAGYPELLQFVAQNTGLYSIDLSNASKLVRLSAEGNDFYSIDLSKCAELRILDISQSNVTSLDLSGCPKLTELYCNNDGSYNNSSKIASLDLSVVPDLRVLFASGNDFTDINLSANTQLTDLYLNHNKLTKLDLSAQPNLLNLALRMNNFDLASLPAPQETYLDYSVWPQRPMKVDYSYPKGAVLDLSAQVLRPGVETYANLFKFNPENESEPIELVVGEDYEYEDGKFTLLTTHTDSLHAEFYCPIFPDGALSTTNFKVKPEDEYGKPSRIVSWTTGEEAGTELMYKISAMFNGASYSSPAKVFVDFGDGNLVEQECYGYLAVNGTVAGPQMAIYAPDGVTLTGLEINDVPLDGINLNEAATLTSLSINNCALNFIDLSRLNLLQRLSLRGNKFARIDLTGANRAVVKNVLTSVDLSNNEIADFVVENRDVITDLNLSNNKLTTLNCAEYKALTDLNVANNQLTELNLTETSALKSLDVSGNQLETLTIPEDAQIGSLYLQNNRFNLATLPARPIGAYSYNYAPQQPYLIPAKGFGADLSSQNLTLSVTNSYWSADEDGSWSEKHETKVCDTQFKWYVKDDNGTPSLLTPGSDYTINAGNTTFAESLYGKTLYCEIINDALPDFSGDNTFHTTNILATAAPTNVVASFTTLYTNRNAVLRLAGKEEGATVYIDWAGNGDLAEYVLSTTYREFEAKTKGNTRVKIYSYEPTNPISVLSITKCPMKDVDLTNLKGLYTLNLSGNELSTLNIPENFDACELLLDNNEFASIDLSNAKNVFTLAMLNNQLSSIDLSSMPGLMYCYLAQNRLSEIDLSKTPNLLLLDLNRNNLSSVDLSSCKYLEGLAIAGNQLTDLNVANLPHLHQLMLDGNKFTFATLPLPSEQWAIYTYSNQETIMTTCQDGIIDLSAQATVGGEATEYYWFLGQPTVNLDSGEVEGVILEEGVDYQIANGVTTWLRDIPEEVVGMMINPVFPRLILFTAPLSVTSGIAQVSAANVAINAGQGSIDVEAPAEAHITITSLQGHLLSSSKGAAHLSGLTPGIYMVVVANETHKVIVK